MTSEWAMRPNTIPSLSPSFLHLLLALSCHLAAILWLHFGLSNFHSLLALSIDRFAESFAYMFALFSSSLNCTNTYTHTHTHTRVLWQFVRCFPAQTKLIKVKTKLQFDVPNAIRGDFNCRFMWSLNCH